MPTPTLFDEKRGDASGVSAHGNRRSFNHCSSSNTFRATPESDFTTGKSEKVSAAVADQGIVADKVAGEANYSRETHRRMASEGGDDAILQRRFGVSYETHTHTWRAVNGA